MECWSNELRNHSFAYYYFVFFGLTIARYFLIAGGAYWLCYIVLRESLASKSLRRQPLIISTIKKDIQSSVISTFAFALGAALIIKEYGWGITLLYTDPHKYGLWYLGASFAATLILQDTYFYFLHRLFHHPWLFKWMHRQHHQSGEPTPWTSFAFDLPEAIVQSLFFLIIVLFVPLHFLTLAAALMTMTVWSAVSHLGFKIFPASFPHPWLSGWLIGAAHHAKHHRQYAVNYGLYFTFWDKLLGTQD